MTLTPKKFSALTAAALPLTGTEDVVLVGNKTKVSDIRRLPSYTVAGKPTAATAGAGRLVFLSDGAGNKKVAVSDGSTWYYMDGTAVA